MKIGLAQLNPRIGDFAQRKQSIEKWIEKGKAERADLLLFPELTLTGYPPRDLLDSKVFVDKNLELLEQLATHCQDIAIVVGFVSRNPTSTGKPFQNSAAFLSEGKVSFLYHKQLLPYYDVFEEERYFEPGAENGVFRFKGKTVALTICEDLWNEGPYLERAYPVHPLKNLVDRKVDLILNISASPFHVGKSELRRRLFSEVAKSLNAALVFCNQVGANDELIFDGCSFALNRRGEFLAVAPAFEETLVFFSDEGTTVEKTPWPTTPEAWHEGALCLGIKDYVSKCGMSKVVLGLSGGIDSSVTAVLAAKALGPASVAGLSMPTRFTSSASQEDAETLAKHLAISLRTMEIEPLFTGFSKALEPLFPNGLASLTLENLQPRLRMICLMAVSNQENSLVLNTSNKSEIAAGYSTLYGDTAGALSVLGDLTKGEVVALARYLNREKTVIPERVITRAPSAELRENQTDEQSLPPYAVLDQMVRESVEFRRPLSEIEKGGVEARWTQLFAKLYGVSEYKRRQFPPVLRVTSHAFGMGRRRPVATSLSEGL